MPGSPSAVASAVERPVRRRRRGIAVEKAISDAVVDGTGAVRGVGKLRVIDASILPAVPFVPTNLTVIMAAEHIYRHALSR
jgi:choline dehydrogenase-like flavoprotein